MTDHASSLDRLRGKKKSIPCGSRHFAPFCTTRQFMDGASSISPGILVPPSKKWAGGKEMYGSLQGGAPSI